MTATDRILDLVTQKLDAHRQALEQMPDLSSVQVIVQLESQGAARPSQKFWGGRLVLTKE